MSMIKKKIKLLLFNNIKVKKYILYTIYYIISKYI